MRGEAPTRSDRRRTFCTSEGSDEEGNKAYRQGASRYPYPRGMSCYLRGYVMGIFKGRRKSSTDCDQRPRLHINNLSLFVHLGYSAEERSVLQEVQVSIEVGFPTWPLGETTDCLEDTLCYDEMCHLLRNYVKGRQFKLIEKMARECLSVLNTKYPFVLIRLTLHKKAPVEGLEGGVKYSCGERFL